MNKNFTKFSISNACEPNHWMFFVPGSIISEEDVFSFKKF